MVGPSWLHTAWQHRRIAPTHVLQCTIICGVWQMNGKIDRSFWRGRTVFVTGHSGFKGSWLQLLLSRLGADVVGYALPPPTDPSLFAMLGFGHGAGDGADIRDGAALGTAVASSGAEIVLHLAAQALVRESYATPAATYDANLMGTVNVLEACRAAPSVRTIVAITTDKVYQNLGLERGYVEDDRLGGRDPYSNSKACAELAVQSYRDSFFAAAGIGVATARAGNVIGGGDFAADRIVPDAVRSFVAGKPLQVRNPLAVRPWQHVLDPLGGYLVLAQALHADPSLAGGWNFGPPACDTASVGVVADKLAALWGTDARWEHDGGEHPHEAHLLRLDPTKAERLLGWTQLLDLDETLALTAKWYRHWAAGEDSAVITAEQCNGFLDRMTC